MKKRVQISFPARLNVGSVHFRIEPGSWYELFFLDPYDPGVPAGAVISQPSFDAEPLILRVHRFLSKQLPLIRTGGAKTFDFWLSRTKEAPGQYQETDATNQDGEKQDGTDFVQESLRIGVYSPGL